MNRHIWLFAIFAERIVGVRIFTHRAWSIESDGGRNVLELAWSKQAQQGSHVVTVELKNAEGVAGREQLVGLFIGI